jgi:hypothetical protein
VSVEYDFADQGTVVLANGPQLITDTTGRTISVTVGNVAAAATFRFLAGTGLQFVANATSSVYTSAAQTASFLEWAFSTMYSTYGVDSTWDMLVRLHVTVQTFPTPNVTGGLTLAVRGVAGTPSNSAARLRGIIRSNQVNTQVMRHGTDGSGGQNYGFPGAVPTVYGIRHEQGAMAAFGGTFATDFDSSSMDQDVGDQPATSANTSGYRDRGNILALAFGTGNVNADVQVTIERMRIDWRATG